MATVEYSYPFSGEWQPYWEWERENGDRTPLDFQGYDDQKQIDRLKTKQFRDKYKRRNDRRKGAIRLTDRDIF